MFHMEKRSRNTLIIIIIIKTKSRVSDQNGVSLLYIMLEIHHSGLQTEGFGPEWCISTISCLRYTILACKLRVLDQNGVSLLYIMLEIHHSGLQTEGFGPEWCISSIYHA